MMDVLKGWLKAIGILLSFVFLIVCLIIMFFQTFSLRQIP